MTDAIVKNLVALLPIESFGDRTSQCAIALILCGVRVIADALIVEVEVHVDKA